MIVIVCGYRVMSSPVPSITLSDIEPEDDIFSVPDHSPAPGHVTSDEESEPTEESTEDFAVVPEIAPSSDDQYVFSREGDSISDNEDPSEADISSPSESPLPSLPKTARIRTIPVPPPHPYMLPTYVPPSTEPIPEETLPSRKRTRPYTPPSSTDFTPLSQPYELSEEVRASIARFNALPRSPTPDFPIPPRVFETGESSQAAENRQPTISTLVNRVERHEEQIETALCHLDELPLERIESMEYTSENIIDKQTTMQQELDTLNTGLQQTREQVHDLAESYGQDIPLLYDNDWLTAQAVVMQNEDIIIAYHRIATLEAVVMDLQAQLQENTQILLSMMAELDNRNGGASGS